MSDLTLTVNLSLSKLEVGEVASELHQLANLIEMRGAVGEGQLIRMGEAIGSWVVE